MILSTEKPGIVECEVIQWFVQPGARVEQFSPLCEVQSDKASSEISSKYDGVIKKLYYEPGEMARVGKPFIDIDTDDISETVTSDKNTIPPPSDSSSPLLSPSVTLSEASQLSCPMPDSTIPINGSEGGVNSKPGQDGEYGNRVRKLAVPAVRHLTKAMGVDISLITGTGKGGRVLKEDVLRFVADKKTTLNDASTSIGVARQQQQQRVQVETTQALTPTQQHMFKTMTRSLTIPHFLYADEVDFTELTALRSRLNKVLTAQAAEVGQDTNTNAANINPPTLVGRLSYLPFIIKAVSLALYRYPILNACVDTSGTGEGGSASNGKPVLIHRSLHNIGVAVDSPAGLIVPVIKDVGSRNVLSIASELVRLQKAAHAGKLSPADLSGGTITVSNIGNIGGTYVSPVIVEKEVAILGIGRMRTVPAFGPDEKLVKKQICNFSWSADHRVIDGATMARAAEVVRKIVQEPDIMIMHLR